MKNSDKPAYPIVYGPYIPSDKGLTKREMFAMTAMQGICACGQILGTEAIAETSIEYADELLKQLDNENQNPKL
jgi:hypothetical protein